MGNSHDSGRFGSPEPPIGGKYPGVRTEDQMRFSGLAGKARRIPESMKLATWRMRNQPTAAEAALWSEIRLKQLEGFRFRQQHVIGGFIADFFCFQAKLVVEVDGSYHFGRDAEDTARDEWMTANGIRVLRFSNEEVLYHIDSVKRKILVTLKEAGPGASPLSGGSGGANPKDI